MGLPGDVEVWFLTDWSRGGDGLSSSFAEPESDFLFREPLTCFAFKQRKQMKIGSFEQIFSTLKKEQSLYKRKPKKFMGVS